MRLYLLKHMFMFLEAIVCMYICVCLCLCKNRRKAQDYIIYHRLPDAMPSGSICVAISLDLVSYIVGSCPLGLE